MTEPRRDSLVTLVGGFTWQIARDLLRAPRRALRRPLQPWLRTLIRPLLVLPARRYLRRQVPVAMITGTKGKTTTTRMLAHILAEAGHVVGYSSTDGIVIAGELVSERDSAGYIGARRVLRDGSVTAAVLETARGDLLRNGVYLDRSDVAALLNVGREQIGMDGVDTVEQMARVKRRVTDTARKRVVLNADNEQCRAVISAYPVSRTTLFTLERDNPTVAAHVAGGGVVFCLEEDGEPRIVRIEGDRTEVLIPVADLPSAWGGIVRHNIANAMAAAALAEGLGISRQTIRAALGSFENSTTQSAGRFNVIQRDPFLVIVDDAVNPPAARAMIDSVKKIVVSGRRICLMTTAGNRPDWFFDELTQILSDGFDRFVIFENPRYLRTRAPGELGELLRVGFLKAGVAPEAIDVVLDLSSALNFAARLPQPGDLLVIGGAFRRGELRAIEELFRELPVA